MLQAGEKEDEILNQPADKIRFDQKEIYSKLFCQSSEGTPSLNVNERGSLCIVEETKSDQIPIDSNGTIMTNP